MNVVTPTDRPKSVRNRCVIDVFDGVLMLSIAFSNFCSNRVFFCHRTESVFLLFIFAQKSELSIL